MNHLEGRLVRLRAIEPEDENILYQWENDPQSWRVSNTLAPFSRLVLRQYLAEARLDIFEAKQLRLVIEINEASKSIGLIDLFDFDPFHQRAGVGILIGDKAERGKGYAADALSVLIDYCFSYLMLNQIYCSISESNAVSLHLFQKAGFRITGKKEKWNRGFAGFTDEWFLQILREDWLVRLPN
jgi:diamine N-acetyltransferase